MDTDKKKALLVATVSGFVPQFEMNNVKLLQSLGYEIHYATNYNMPVYTCNNDRLNGTGIIRHQIDFVRSPFSQKNVIALNQLKRLMRQEKFELLHCHTPMGGVLARFAAKKEKIPYVIYTAHGFHFFKGASIINWLCFYQVEKFLARYTDVLITINKEDYENASKFKLKKDGKLVMIPGVGVDSAKKIPHGNTNLKSELGIENNKIVLTSVGELTKRKNHQVIIHAMAEVIKKYPDTLYLICGTGALQERLEKLIIQLRLQDNVKLLGYRTDVNDILGITDCFIFPSLQEGLPVAVLEAMNAGLAVICSNIRGNKDLIENGKGGYLVKTNSVNEYVQYIEFILKKMTEYRSMGDWNKERVKMFDQNIAIEKMQDIYCRNI